MFCDRPPAIVSKVRRINLGLSHRLRPVDMPSKLCTTLAESDPTLLAVNTFDTHRSISQRVGRNDRPETAPAGFEAVTVDLSLERPAPLSRLLAGLRLSYKSQLVTRGRSAIAVPFCADCAGALAPSSAIAGLGRSGQSLEM